MAKKYTLMNKEAIDELCKAVRESHSVSEAIDDDNLATNSTFSSVKIDNLIEANKAENKEYTDKKIDESISGTIDDTLSNTSENAVQNKVIKSYVDNSLANIQTTLNGKVDKEEGKSLISDSEITRLANVKNYDDTKVKSDISSMNTAINTNKTSIANIQSTLNSKANSADVYTKSETDTKITEKVAEIVAGAPADFDTLKEMSDWIANHEGSAAAMNSAINANAENIANLQAEIGDMESETIRADDADSEGKCQLYKTVNGERVDIEPKVSGGSSPYIYMTQAEYEALDTYQPGKMYWVIYPATGCYLVWKDGVCIDGDGKDRIGGIKYTDSGNYTHYQKCPYRNLAIAFNPCNDNDAQISVYDYLENLDIAKNVTNIGAYAFYKSVNLKNVKMPNVSTIGNNAFYNCTALIEADLGKKMETIEKNAFNGCSSLTSITIPDSVTSIGVSAFNGCSSLTSVALPIGAGITFDTNVFDNCSNFKSIIFLSSPNNNSITSSDISYFKEKYPSCIVNVSLPDGLLSINVSTFSNCSKLVNITIPDSVTSIGQQAFYKCTSLASIIIPDSVTSIESQTFSGCTGLTSVTIGNGVTSIEIDAFNGCSSLTSITIPDSVTSIGDNVFNGCTSLASVTIGNSVTSIGQQAFYKCTSLESITIPDSVTNIGSYALGYTTKLADIYYTGTRSQWNAITKSTNWNSNMGSSVSGGTKIHYNYVPE